MARPASKQPTDLELQILKCLWRQGRMTGREIRECLSAERELTYQSVMTVLGIMEDKGFVTRKKQGASYDYRPRVSERATRKRMLHDLVQRLFDGSAAAAMVNLLETSKLSEAELAELQETVERRKGGTGDDQR